MSTGQRPPLTSLKPVVPWVTNWWLPRDRAGDVDIQLAWFYHGARRREDLEREYFQFYHEHDERLPRLRQLPDGQIAHVTTLFDEEELQTSRTYNEMLRRTGTRNALNVRLDGPYGSRIVWAIGDPIGGGAWQSDQIATVERLLPHIRQYVQIRQALVGAEALGTSLAELLDNTRIGVIYLDRRGRIVEANDRALEFIGRNNGLLDRDGYLRARRPTDDGVLQTLLSEALPSFRNGVSGGSMTIPAFPRAAPAGGSHQPCYVTPGGVQRSNASPPWR